MVSLADDHLREQGYFSCLNTYDRACFTFGHMQLGAHTPNDNFVLLLRELLQEPLAAAYFPDLVLSDGRVHHRSDAGLTPLESDTDTDALMAYLNRTADDVDENETQRAARFIDWTLTSAGARELQVAFVQAAACATSRNVEPWGEGLRPAVRRVRGTVGGLTRASVPVRSGLVPFQSTSV